MYLRLAFARTEHRLRQHIFTASNRIGGDGRQFGFMFGLAIFGFKRLFVFDGLGLHEFMHYSAALPVVKIEQPIGCTLFKDLDQLVGQIPDIVNA